MADAADSDRNSSSQDGLSADASQSEVEADIARTREELGRTVEQLSEKLDVKAQAQHKVDDIKQNAADAVDEARHKVTGAVDSAKAKVHSTFAQGQTATSEPEHEIVVGPGGQQDGSSPAWKRAALPAFASGACLTVAAIVLAQRKR